jgi:hypothetical protein
MKIKADLTEAEFDGLDAKLFMEVGGTTTVLFWTLSKEWAAFSIGWQEESGRLNFYEGTEVVKTKRNISLEDAVTLVRAAQIERRAS